MSLFFSPWQPGIDLELLVPPVEGGGRTVNARFAGLPSIAIPYEQQHRQVRNLFFFSLCGFFFITLSSAWAA